MKVFSAKEAKDEFSRFLESAQSGPVQVEKKGKPVAVLVSLEEYKRLGAIEDAWWAEKAKKSAKGGYLSTKKSEKLLMSLLNAKD